MSRDALWITAVLMLGFLAVYALASNWDEDAANLAIGILIFVILAAWWGWHLALSVRIWRDLRAIRRLMESREETRGG